MLFNYKQNILEKEYFGEIYDILISHGGAQANMKESFVQSHLTSEGKGDSYSILICREWRFCGHFGFGGKYRRDRNKIDYYNEDMNPKLNQLMEEINNLLEIVYTNYTAKGMELEINRY